MDKKDFAFGRMNFILLGVGMLIVIIGFILMSGGSTTPDAYNPDIFSTRRIVVAPLVCFFGFVSMIYAVVHNPNGSRSPKQWFSDLKATAKTPTNTNEGLAMLALLGMAIVAFGSVLLVKYSGESNHGKTIGEGLVAAGAADVVGACIFLFLKKGKKQEVE